MHISEGILPPEVLIGGAIITLAGTAWGLRKIHDEEIPIMGILSAAFFVASLIHVPAGFVSVHLVLNGLVGLMLGWSAFPVILISLTLQAILFQFGGLTTLGINTLNMAGPAVFCYFCFGWIKNTNIGNRSLAFITFVAGFSAIVLSGIMVGVTLALSGEAFWAVAKVAVGAHIPVAIIEGILTASCISFLKRVKPELLNIKGIRHGN